MKPGIFIALLALFLGACSTAPQVSQALPEREAMREFAIEARFSVKIERVGEPVQSGSGRLSWSHKNGTDQVFIANPLGGGLADIDIGPQISRLRSAQGQVFENSDPDLLIQQATGYALPVSRLAPWLLGRAGADGVLSRDALGRPVLLREAGWQIEYAYADESPMALPFRLNINRASEVALTLRIEEWRDAP